MNYFQGAWQSWIEMREYWEHQIELGKKKKGLKGDVE